MSWIITGFIFVGIAFSIAAMIIDVRRRKPVKVKIKRNTLHLLRTNARGSKLEMRYHSEQSGHLLHIQVTGVAHAERLIGLLGLLDAQVGYHDENRKWHVLYRQWGSQLTRELKTK